MFGRRDFEELRRDSVRSHTVESEDVCALGLSATLVTEHREQIQEVLKRQTARAVVRKDLDRMNWSHFIVLVGYTERV